MASTTDVAQMRLKHSQDQEVWDLLGEVEMLRSLVAELVDPEGCWYDHHGYCQAHSLAEKPCPHERAKTALGVGNAGSRPEVFGVEHQPWADDDGSELALPGPGSDGEA